MGNRPGFILQTGGVYCKMMSKKNDPGGPVPPERKAPMNILESVLDSSSHAIFTLDRDGIVTHINHQAKESFGLYNHSQQSHAAGRLEQGDLVILATTVMGDDDGGLQQEDLAVLGIRDKKIQPGDMLAAVGIFGEGTMRPVYKFLRRRDAGNMTLETEWEGIPIRIAIDGQEVSAAVGGVVYTISARAKATGSYQKDSMTIAENIGHTLGLLTAVSMAAVFGMTSPQIMLVFGSVSALLAVVAMALITRKENDHESIHSEG